MAVPERFRLAAVVVGCILGLVALPAQGGDGAGERERLDRIEQRLDALEKRLGAGEATPSSPVRDGSSVPAIKTETTAYRPGAVVLVHPTPTNPRLLSEVPSDSVGGFVYTGDPLTFHDLSGRGIRYAGLLGIELQGWLRVATAGRTQFDENLHVSLGGQTVVGPECVFRVWLEDREVGIGRGRVEVGAGRESRLDLLLGANIQPGLYKLRLWNACSPTGNPRDLRITADLLVKAPDDLNLRNFAADELLHQP